MDSIHDHPSKAHPFTALRAIYTAYLGRSLCLYDSLCQPLFSSFFTTDPALWILTVWSLLPHKQTLRTPYQRSPALLHSAPGLCAQPQLSIQTLVVSQQPVREKCCFHCLADIIYEAFDYFHIWEDSQPGIKYEWSLAFHKRDKEMQEKKGKKRADLSMSLYVTVSLWASSGVRL